MRKKELTIDDFNVHTPEHGMSYVHWDEIEQKMSKQEYKKFMKWMFGQTCSGDGCYAYDLARYLRAKNGGYEPHFD